MGARTAGRTYERLQRAGRRRRVDRDHVGEAGAADRGRPRAPPTSRRRSRRRGPAASARGTARARPPRAPARRWRRGPRAGRRCRRRARRARRGPTATSRARRSHGAEVARRARPRRRRRGAGSPSTSIGAGAARRAWRSTSRGSTAPFQRLTSSRTAASTGSSGRAAGARPAPNCTQRERGAAGVQREGDVRALPHRPRVGELRRRDEQRHRRVALPERRQPLELLGQLAASARRRTRPRRRAPSARGRPARAPRRRARRTTRGTRPRASRAIVSPAAARWPP